MAIPTYEEAMLPVLRLLATKEPQQRREIAAAVADHFGLSQAERDQLLPSGKATTILSRVGWALSYLKQARVVESTKRGVYQLTQRGRDLLAERPTRVDGDYLSRFPEFVDFRNRVRPTGPETSESVLTDPEKRHEAAGAATSPEEALEGAYAGLRAEVEEELLDTIKSSSPAFFEQLVVDLLVKMGYGGNRQEAARAVGRSGDDGIDGVIDEDRLGLDVVYIQAKRWDAVVGRPEIQKFAGALQGQRARKGIFITTSSFSREAEEYIQRIDSRIVLIDGHRLARLMFDHDLGVNPRSTYTVKQVDSDYFEDA